MPQHDRLEALLSVPALFGAAVSPDGGWVAWSWSRLGPAADVFAAPTDGSRPPLRLTETSEGDTVVVSWAPDSGSVIVSEDRDGNERVRLFRVWPDEPGNMQPLTEPEPEYFLGGGELHPNGRWLVYNANFDPETGEEIEQTCVYRHDLKTGEKMLLVRPKRNIGPSSMNRQGTHVLYSRNDLDPSGRQIWLVDTEGREDREILNFGARTKVTASWLPDGRRVVFVAEAGSHRRLGVWDDGAVSWLIDDPARNVGYAFAPPNGGPAVVVGVEQGRVRASLLDVESGVETPLEHASGNLVPLAPVDDERWVCTYYDARHPVDLVHFGEPGAEPCSITDLPRRIPADLPRLAPAEDFRWRSVDALEAQGWLYRAAGESVGTIVLIHGGPTSHAEDRFSAQIQYFVSRGFDVFVPNYRGSTGFGLPFQESIKEDGWGGREQEDIRCGIEALIHDGVSEPGRVGVTGTSYGGYSAWWAITHFGPQTVAAAAPICGMTDLTVDYAQTRPDLRPYSEEMMGGSPEQVPDIYRERSPIQSVRNVRGELLIVQGLRDPNVTPANVSAATEALHRENIPYSLLTFEDEGHGIARPENLRILYPRLADFFQKAFESAAQSPTTP